MKKLILLTSIIILIVACKKSTGNNPVSDSGNVTFNINGTNYSNSVNNFAQFIYLDSNFSSIQFEFQKIHLGVGSPFNSPGYPFKNYYGTDSFLVNTEYQAAIPIEIYIGSSINGLTADYRNYRNIKVTITSYLNDKISGTFYGAVKGFTYKNEYVADTIANGTFTNIPVLRHY